MKEEVSMNEELISLYNWFDIRRDDLIKDHEGEWVLVSGNESFGYFKSQSEAVSYAQSHGFKMGTFLAQLCIPREQERNMFYSVNRGVFYA